MLGISPTWLTRRKSIPLRLRPSGPLTSLASPIHSNARDEHEPPDPTDLLRRPTKQSVETHDGSRANFPPKVQQPQPANVVTLYWQAFDPPALMPTADAQNDQPSNAPVSEATIRSDTPQRTQPTPPSANRASADGQLLPHIPVFALKPCRNESFAIEASMMRSGALVRRNSQCICHQASRQNPGPVRWMRWTDGLTLKPVAHVIGRGIIPEGPAIPTSVSQPDEDMFHPDRRAETAMNQKPMHPDRVGLRRSSQRSKGRTRRSHSNLQTRSNRRLCPRARCAKYQSDLLVAPHHAPVLCGSVSPDNHTIR